MSPIRVTLERSSIGHPRDQKATVRALGLRRMHQTVVVANNPSIRGMIHKVRHLVRVEVIEETEDTGAEQS
ncbi:MAG TPA: 50S ribosomal protein L30 [Chloroflexota bacterium]|jgi:large subunit ribosomal protein L30|nr:50S ribosomal protein L30 [Chloroflexota bacterium]